MHTCYGIKVVVEYVKQIVLKKDKTAKVGFPKWLRINKNLNLNHLEYAIKDGGHISDLFLKKY